MKTYYIPYREASQAARYVGDQENPLWVYLHGANIPQRVKIIVGHYYKKVRFISKEPIVALVLVNSRQALARYQRFFIEYLEEKELMELQDKIRFVLELPLKGEETVSPLPVLYLDQKLSETQQSELMIQLKQMGESQKTDELFILDFNHRHHALTESFPRLDELFPLFWDLKRRELYQWEEVEHFVEFFYQEEISLPVLLELCTPTVKRWRVKSDPSFLAELDRFLGLYQWFQFMIDVDKDRLEKLALYAFHLLPLLRGEGETLSPNYRLAKIKEFQVKQQEMEKREERRKQEEVKKKGKNPFSPKAMELLNQAFQGSDSTEDQRVEWMQGVVIAMSSHQGVVERLTEEMKKDKPDQTAFQDFTEVVKKAIVCYETTPKRIAERYFSSPEAKNVFLTMVYHKLKNEPDSMPPD